MRKITKVFNDYNNQINDLSSNLIKTEKDYDKQIKNNKDFMNKTHLKDINMVSFYLDNSLLMILNFLLIYITMDLKKIIKNNLYNINTFLFLLFN